MNIEQTKSAIAVMQAYVDGKTVQVGYSEGAWSSFLDDPAWNWERNQYRIKPKLREWWMRKHLGYNEPCSSCGLFKTLAEAKRAAADNQQTIEIIHLREVIE